MKPVKRPDFVGFCCPTCGKPSTVNHTYRKAVGTQRRRICEKGHRFTTMERIYTP